jgi:hypothetical protein
MALTQVDQGLLSANAQYTGFKNRLINSAMGISQRTAVNTNVAVGTGPAGTFGPDRFTGYTGTGSLWNISQVSTSDYDFPYALRLQRIAGQTSTSAVYLRQVVETVNCKDLAGQSVTISFYVTAGTNYSGGAASFQVYTGTAADQGTSSLNTGAWTGFAAPLSSTFTPTTTRARVTLTGTLGATVQEVAFGLNWSGSGTAGANDYLDITGVQLEKGSTATSFDYRPYGTELALCQRYYYKIFPNAADSSLAGAGSTTSATVATYMNGSFPVTMRVAPTALEQSGTASDYQIVNPGAANVNSNAVPTFLAATNKYRYFVRGTVASGLASGTIANLETNTANGFLAWSAEL